MEAHEQYGSIVHDITVWAMKAGMARFIKRVPIEVDSSIAKTWAR